MSRAKQADRSHRPTSSRRIHEVDEVDQCGLHSVTEITKLRVQARIVGRLDLAPQQVEIRRMKCWWGIQSVSGLEIKPYNYLLMQPHRLDSAGRSGNSIAWRAPCRERQRPPSTLVAVRGAGSR